VPAGETTIFSDVTTATGRVLSLRTKSLGSFDRSELLAGTEKVRAMIYDYFATHEIVTRDAKSYELKVFQVQGNELTNIRVIFQQIVNGLPVEPKSHIDVSVAGNVIALVLYVANPAHPYFDSSVWLDKPQLIALARAAWADRCTSPLPAGPGTEEFLITLNQESWEFNPVFQLSFGTLVTQIHAVTGVTVLAQNLSTHHATECR
jgi:Zn-dependent metalloprotease